MSIVKENSFRFKREEHLKKRKEIREVFGKGRWYEFRGTSGRQSARLFVLKNSLPYNRICFTFSKSKDWNAVLRNRARRLGREAFRLMKSRLLGGHDLILLVFNNCPDNKGKAKNGQSTAGSSPVSAVSGKIRRETLSDRMAQLEFLFKRAGLLK